MGKPGPQGSLLAEYIGQVELTRRTETSQYPEEQTSTEIPRVVASESGTGQWSIKEKQNSLESLAIAGDSPVCVVLW